MIITTHRHLSLLHLHVCDLVLFPVEAFHLVLFQLLPGLHVLVIVTLKTTTRIFNGPNGFMKSQRVV